MEVLAIVHQFNDFHLVDDEIVLLVMAYAKAERTNVKVKEIKRIWP